MTQERLLGTLPDRLLQLGVPRNLIGRLCEKPFQCTPALQAVEAWWHSGERTLVLVGGKGCGKTFAACAAIEWHRRDQSERAFALTQHDLPSWWIWLGAKITSARHLAGLRAWDEEDRAELKTLTATSLLILDDLGLEDGEAERAVGALLADRHAAEKRTILTCNLNEENFRKRYRDRVISRIEDSGRINTVHGPDLRAKGAACQHT